MIVVPADRIRAYKEKGWWGDKRLQDFLEDHVRAKPGATACMDPKNCEDIIGRAPLSLTWRELDDLVRRLTALLVKQGLCKDDAIVVQLPNVVELGAIYLACARLGIIISPAPVQYRENELSFIVGQVNARGLITATRIGGHAHAEMALNVQQSQPGLEHVIAIGDPVEGPLHADTALAALDEADFAAANEAVGAANVTADDVFTICWTSGTESSPKGVPRSHNEWIIMAEGIIDAGDIEPGDHLLNPFPMVNMAGISTSFVSWLLVGGVLIQHHPFDLQVFLQQIREEKADYTVAPPAVLNLLLQNEALLEGIDFERLNNIGSGSAPLSERMVGMFFEKYGVRITNFFGSNEGACFTSAYKDVPNAADRATYFPRFADGFTWHAKLHDRITTRLVDPETEDEITERDRVGELRVKGPTVFSGYWSAPDITERAFDQDGWFRTGDLFKIAGENLEFYAFAGRLKDVIIRGGMNISSEELENYLLGHDAIADAALVGAPDPKLGERICAFVVFKPGQSADLASINQYLVEDKKVAVFKQIERLEIVDALPRNPVGKVLKRDLRERLQDG